MARFFIRQVITIFSSFLNKYFSKFPFFSEIYGISAEWVAGSAEWVAGSAVKLGGIWAEILAEFWQDFGISSIWPSNQALKLVYIDRELHEDSHGSNIVKIEAIQRQFRAFCKIAKFV